MGRAGRGNARLHWRARSCGAKPPHRTAVPGAPNAPARVGDTGLCRSPCGRTASAGVPAFTENRHPPARARLPGVCGGARIPRQFLRGVRARTGRAGTATLSLPSRDGRIMETVTSKDGTSIAFDRAGSGPTLILVGGAFEQRAMESETAFLAAHPLLTRHFTVVHYDRRGRGDSTDTLPYALEREFEDIEALID